MTKEEIRRLDARYHVLVWKLEKCQVVAEGNQRRLLKQRNRVEGLFRRLASVTPRKRRECLKEMFQLERSITETLTAVDEKFQELAELRGELRSLRRLQREAGLSES